MNKTSTMGKFNESVLFDSAPMPHLWPAAIKTIWRHAKDKDEAMMFIDMLEICLEAE